MHKNFAKTGFLGKTISSLPECHSTNDHMAQLATHGQVNHGDIIATDFQTKGKGQRGNMWSSERGKNLLFSIFIQPENLNVSEAYLLNIVSGLSMVEMIKKINPSLNCKLKWPNDVYISDRKISGILIETSLSNRFDYAVIGIGLNVNQTYFPLSSATSLKIETGEDYNLSKLLENYAECFEPLYIGLLNGSKGKILRSYHDNMYWRGETHIYSSKGEEFEAEIIGINEIGNLVLNCNGVKKTYRMKEVEFIQ
ncbi:MAG: biotin--[acetyl-CoA-carboxylase] ligase [Bacteroidota bacterium]